MSKGVKDKLLETLEIFHKNNIEVIPHYGVKEGTNTKKHFKPIEAWKSTPYSYEKNIKAVEDGILGFIVRPGIKSNILVIDYDYHGKETTNTTNILQRLKDTSTFYIITPTGGYHFYFEYDKRIKINKICIFNNIDIKTEGGLLFLGIREDGEYTINYKYALVKKIPDDILTELLEWKKPIKEKSYIYEKTKHIEENEFNNIERYKNGIRYNITDEQLYKYLYDLPREYLDDTTEWKNISFVLKKYGYRDVWYKWSKQSKYYDEKGNNKIWNTMKTDKDIKDLNYIITILNDTTYRNNKIAPIKKIFKEYEILNEANLKKITSKIHTRYLDKSLYENGMDTIGESNLNTGKSFSNAQNAKINKQLYFSIVALTSTQESQYQSFKNEGIKSFSYKNIKKLNKDFKFIKDDDDDDETDEDTEDDIDDFNKYIKEDDDFNNACIFTTIDSLLLFRDKNINFKNRIVYLDEIHSLFLYLLRCDNLTKKRMEIFAFLIRILKECKQIIAVDGDICNNTITLIELLKRGKYQFIVNTYKSYNNIKCYRMSNMNDMIEMIKQDIKNKEVNICCCNTKTLADKLKEILLKNGVPPSQILLYTSKSGKPIKNINEEWKDKYVIYSPSIVAGLDFTPPTPINTYSFIDGVNTLNPEQIGQQICRNRNIKNVYLYMENMTNILKYEDMNALKSHYKKNILSLKSSSSFLSLMNRNLNPTTYEIEYTDTIFNEMYYELEYQNDIMKSSYEYNLYNILSKKGFNIIDDNDINVRLDKNVNTQIIVKIKENDENQYDKYINNELETDDKYKVGLDKVLEILGIDDTDIDTLLDYNDIISNQKAFNTHLKIRCLLYDDETLKKKLNETVNTDFFIKLVKNNVLVVFNYKRIMRKYLPNIDLYKYEYDYDDEYLDENVNIEIEDFKYIKSVIRTTKNVNLPTHKRALVDLMTLYATHIFSKDMIKSVKKNKKIEGKTKTYYSREFNQDLFQKHLSLFKIFLLKNNNIKNICRVIKQRYYKDIYDDTNDIKIDNINDIIDYYNTRAEEERKNIIEPTEPIIKKKKTITLKQKILSYQHLEHIINIEDVEHFKQVYNDLICCSFIDKRNILREHFNNIK